jgi:hypothetical protein
MTVPETTSEPEPSAPNRGDGEPDVTEIEGWSGEPGNILHYRAASPIPSKRPASPFQVSCPKCDPVEYCCQPPTYIYLAVLLVHAGILLGIGLGVMRPNLDDRKYYTQSTCTGLSLGEARTRCCQVDQCSCTECNLLNPSCANNVLVAQPSNRSLCCGSSCCAQTCCSTCCVQKCDSDNKNCRMVCTSCNCYCCRPVNHETCSFRCGTCFTLGVTYQLQFNQVIYTQSFSCDLDDWACQQNVWRKYAAGFTWQCWYDSRDPDHVRFDGIPKLNVAAIVFFAIFCFTLLVSTIVWQCVLWRQN